MKFYAVMVILFCINLLLTFFIYGGLALAFSACCTGQNRKWFGGRIIFTALGLIFAPMPVCSWLLWAGLFSEIPS